MNDKEIDQLDFVTVQVTPETMDAHIQCLEENGYSIKKKVNVFTTCLLCFMFGFYLMAVLLK